MTRGVQNVRRAIKQRKKMRELQNPAKTMNQPFPIIQEEEKHGYLMPLQNSVPFKSKKHNQKQWIKSSMTIKAIISLCLFFGTAFIMSNENATFSSARFWLTNQLQDEFPFAKVQSWYVSALGSPLSISPQGNHSIDTDNESLILPVIGQVVETFNVNGTGIMISPNEKSAVTSLDGGVVIFAGNDKQTKKTITVQHADGSNTTYGYLSSIDVHLYQNVQANERIGSFSPTEENEVVYFSIEKNNKYIDPSQVITVDDIP